MPKCDTCGSDTCNGVHETVQEERDRVFEKISSTGNEPARLKCNVDGVIVEWVFKDGDLERIE